jgi:hypothetical protein
MNNQMPTELELDEKLKDILNLINKSLAEDVQMWVIPQIKQVFADAGYITPEQVAKTQDLVNQMANLANDMARVPTVQYVSITDDQREARMLMTGQEWYDRFEKELKSGLALPEVMDIWVRVSAKRAAGLSD